MVHIGQQITSRIDVRDAGKKVAVKVILFLIRPHVRTPRTDSWGKYPALGASLPPSHQEPAERVQRRLGDVMLDPLGVRLRRLGGHADSA